ncbi:hypothetical protein C8T65DRAFT_695356 [Cerioporus squamosus]|nr:hypothetical protein C8T65DRAFT_695356 [Cerioporus squamosus]
MAKRAQPDDDDDDDAGAAPPASKKKTGATSGRPTVEIPQRAPKPSKTRRQSQQADEEPDEPVKTPLKKVRKRRYVMVDDDGNEIVEEEEPPTKKKKPAPRPVRKPPLPKATSKPPSSKPRTGTTAKPAKKAAPPAQARKAAPAKVGSAKGKERAHQSEEEGEEEAAGESVVEEEQVQESSAEEGGEEQEAGEEGQSDDEADGDYVEGGSQPGDAPQESVDADSSSTEVVYIRRRSGPAPVSSQSTPTALPRTRSKAAPKIAAGSTSTRPTTKADTKGKAAAKVAGPPSSRGRRKSDPGDDAQGMQDVPEETKPAPQRRTGKKSEPPPLSFPFRRPVERPPSLWLFEPAEDGADMAAFQKRMQSLSEARKSRILNTKELGNNVCIQCARVRTECTRMVALTPDFEFADMVDTLDLNVRTLVFTTLSEAWELQALCARVDQMEQTLQRVEDTLTRLDDTFRKYDNVFGMFAQLSGLQSSDAPSLTELAAAARLASGQPYMSAPSPAPAPSASPAPLHARPSGSASSQSRPPITLGIPPLGIEPTRVPHPFSIPSYSPYGGATTGAAFYQRGLQTDPTTPARPSHTSRSTPGEAGPSHASGGSQSEAGPSRSGGARVVCSCPAFVARPPPPLALPKYFATKMEISRSFSPVQRLRGKIRQCRISNGNSLADMALQQHEQVLWADPTPMNEGDTRNDEADVVVEENVGHALGHQPEAVVDEGAAGADAPDVNTAGEAVAHPAEVEDDAGSEADSVGEQDLGAGALGGDDAEDTTMDLALWWQMVEEWEMDVAAFSDRVDDLEEQVLSLLTTLEEMERPLADGEWQAAVEGVQVQETFFSG